MKVETGNKIRNFVRVCYAALFLFEFANYLNILHFGLDFTWLGLVITSGAVFIGIEVIAYSMKRYAGATLHWVAWPLSFLSISIDAFGDILHFYSSINHYDKYAHYIGGGVAAIFILTIFWGLSKAGNWSHPEYLIWFTALGLTMMLASMYEMEEYLEDFFRHVVGVRLGDGPDTAGDLLFGFLGALTVITTVMLSHRIKKRKAAGK